MCLSNKILYHLMRNIIDFNFPHFSYKWRKVMCHNSPKGGICAYNLPKFENKS